MPRLAVAVITLFFVAGAQKSDRPPWEWTLEERIRDRSDPVKARERVAASKAKESNLGVQSVGDGVRLDGDSIDGHRNPELFLPIELFRIFVSGAFVEDRKGREVFRTARAELSSVPLPPDFWSGLEEITLTYMSTLNRAQEINREAGAAEGAERRRLQLESETLQARQCRTLAENLDTARKRFGEKFFDRFLYESLAPTAGMGFQRPSTPAELTWLARGCR